MQEEMQDLRLTSVLAFLFPLLSILDSPNLISSLSSYLLFLGTIVLVLRLNTSVLHKCKLHTSRINTCISE